MNDELRIILTKHMPDGILLISDVEPKQSDKIKQLIEPQNDYQLKPKIHLSNDEFSRILNLDSFSNHPDFANEFKVNIIKLVNEKILQKFKQTPILEQLHTKKFDD